MIQNIYAYKNVTAIENKKVYVYICSKHSFDFAIRLFNKDINFHAFLCDRNIQNTSLYGKEVINISEIKNDDDYVIVCSCKDFDTCKKNLALHSLDGHLLKMEFLNDNIANSSNIVMYGTGSRVLKVYPEWKETIDFKYFCDSSSLKHGTEFEGKEIISPEKLMEMVPDTVVIIVSSFEEEIYSKLLGMGFPEERIFSMKYNEDFYLSSKHDLAEYYLHSLLHVCQNRPVVLYGKKEEVVSIKNRLKLFGIEKVESLERISEAEDGTIYKLLYYDLKDTVCIFTDTLNYITYDSVRKMNLNEKNCYWMEKVFNEFRSFDSNMVISTILDPTLGYADIFVDKSEDIPGFVTYQYQKNNATPVKIVLLGGSTSASYAMRHGSWGRELHLILKEKGIAHVIYSGGQMGYTASLELLKFIRDGIMLKPDIVVSYSGVNNRAEVLNERYPFIHIYQEGLYDRLTSEGKFKYGKIHLADTEKKVNYGIPQNGVDAFSFWMLQERMIYAICKQFHITFKAFLQPMLFSKKKFYEKDLEILAAYHVFKSIEEDDVYIYEDCEDSDRGVGNRKNVVSQKELRDKALEVKNDVSFFVDLSDLFDEKDDMYIDFCHVCNEGNQIIASKIYEEIQQEIEEIWK